MTNQGPHVLSRLDVTSPNKNTSTTNPRAKQEEHSTLSVIITRAQRLSRSLLDWEKRPSGCEARWIRSTDIRRIKLYSDEPLPSNQQHFPTISIFEDHQQGMASQRFLSRQLRPTKMPNTGVMEDFRDVIVNMHKYPAWT
jgi:hypothetical protein